MDVDVVDQQLGVAGVAEQLHAERGEQPGGDEDEPVGQLLQVMTVANGVFTYFGRVLAQGAGKKSWDSEFMAVT